MGLFAFGKKKNGVEYLVVGLGNPGKEYENTRHNAGFLAVDYILGKRNKAAERLKYSALTAQVEINGKNVLFMKPQTFMNLSGNAVSQGAAFYKIPPEKIIVISDDVSFNCGVMRIKRQGSHGGHNGLKSISASIGSTAFPRIKLGVGVKPNPNYDMADWVLSKFTKSELEALSANFDKVNSALELIIDGEMDKAMNLFNR